MALDFYIASGSPPSWRVWLSLEHKQLPYELHLLSFSNGDNKKPEYLAINPRHKVPSIVDDGFALYESVAIVEYLEQRYPKSGSPLFPQDVHAAALARRIIQEVDHYYTAANLRLARQTLFKPPGEGDAKEIEEARDALRKELAYFEKLLTGEYLAGSLSVADYAVYPYLALGRRIDQKQPEHGISEFFGPKLKAWMQRIEALPYYDKTYPPHWKASSS